MSDELAENEALTGVVIEPETTSKELTERYPEEPLDEDDDNGTMPENVAELRELVVGHKVVNVDTVKTNNWRRAEATILTLDNGYQVALVDTDDCCAYTSMGKVILNLDNIDHVIMGVGTTEGYSKWHIYADLGDVVEMEVGWSCGNPFYYGYGFDIIVRDPSGREVKPRELES